MLTRVRLEATGKTQKEVKDDLVTAIDVVRALVGGKWMEEKEEEKTDYLQTTKDGYWSRVTIKRVVLP